MKKRSFKGGTHPPAKKELTAKSPIAAMPLPEEVLLPLSQHLGAPAKPLVKPNDRVKTGQKIAEATGFVSVPLHSSISGTVKEIAELPHPTLGVGLAIRIEGDGDDVWDEGTKERANYSGLTPKELREIIREAGIAGMGGAAFPTHVKLSPPQEKPIDTFILNGAECEPWLTADQRLMLENGEGILEGMRLIMRTLGCQKGCIGIETNKGDAIKNLQKLSSAYGYEVIPLKVKYPQGGEKQLIKAITGREVPLGGLPMDVGCVVHNVGTAYAVYEAVAKGKPLIERVVTVTGTIVKNPQNLRTRIGTPFAKLIEECGGTTETMGKLINGGPMMGIAVETDEVPVIKGTSGVLALSQKEARYWEPRPCIYCGRCVDTCPMGLMPNMIGNLAEKEKFASAKEYGVLNCIECGSCSFVCPARRNLVHLFKYAKAKLAQRKES